MLESFKEKCLVEKRNSLLRVGLWREQNKKRLRAWLSMEGAGQRSQVRSASGTTAVSPFLHQIRNVFKNLARFCFSLWAKKKNYISYTVFLRKVTL